MSILWTLIQLVVLDHTLNPGNPSVLPYLNHPWLQYCFHLFVWCPDVSSLRLWLVLIYHYNLGGSWNWSAMDTYQVGWRKLIFQHVCTILNYNTGPRKSEDVGKLMIKPGRCNQIHMVSPPQSPLWTPNKQPCVIPHYQVNWYVPVGFLGWLINPDDISILMSLAPHHKLMRELYQKLKRRKHHTIVIICYHCGSW